MSNNNIDEELDVAVYKEDLKELRSLLSDGANPNFEPRYNWQLPFQHWYRNKLLHYVNRAEIVKELLFYGARVDSRNFYGETPLHSAIIFERTTKLVRELLKHGADVNAKDRFGNTPLHRAVKMRHKNLEVIRELLEYGADINIKLIYNSKTSLDYAIRFPECAKLLIKFALMKNFSSDYKKIVNLIPYESFRTYSELSLYFDECVCEIMQMKIDKIDDSLSLYELITAREANEVLYVYDDVAKSIKNGVFQVLTSKSYPIYHDVISAKIGASLVRENLLDKLGELEVYTKLDGSNNTEGAQEKTVVLDSYSKEEVAQYLSNIDLLNFTAAFCRYSDEPSCLKANFSESTIQPNAKLYDASTSNYPKRARLE